MTVGRFLTRDPLGYAGGLDLYAYCLNDPVNLADPSGLCPDGGGDSMRSGHPGMQAGTEQSDDANQMLDDLKDTLIWAAAGPVLDGVGGIVEGAVDLEGAIGAGVARVRHYTDDSGLKGIKTSGNIDPTLRAGQEGVHVAGPPYDPTLGERVGAAGTGRYVEFDAPGGMEDTTAWNNNHGIPTYRIPINTPFPIAGRNPTFGPPWWKFWR